MLSTDQNWENDIAFISFFFPFLNIIAAKIILLNMVILGEDFFSNEHFHNLSNYQTQIRQTHNRIQAY